ncbi:MAG: glutamyl-tRNA reductase [Acidimicrobiaceae bacterium]|nr:glutamyl-tRNA reductase [Acidimicrobiaceae bacterium]
MPLDLFEQFAIGEEALPKALAGVHGCRNISEAIVLSTCNRTEVYVYAEKFHGAYQDVRDFFAETAQIAPESFNDYLYAHYDSDAIQHLFSVTCGLDSAVVGENEVQHQVKVAWERAREEGTCGTVINEAFRRALEVGKRVRTQTDLSRNSSSVAKACVEMANHQLGNLADQRILVLGAGEVGEGVATSLATLETGHISFINRSFERAHELAKRIDAEAIPFEKINEALSSCDVLLTSTASDSAIFDRARLETIMDGRKGKELLIIDIAVPRDVDPAAASIDGITLFDIDALWSFRTKNSLISNDGAYLEAREIISEEVVRYLEQQSARQVAPLIAGFRNSAEEIRQAELKRFESRLASLSEEQRNTVESLTQGILGKILHEPTIAMNEAAGSPRGDRLAEALRELFNI